jgi:FtsP/CotA-like multicopper oxidase with cupredoxin domain
MSHWTGAGEIKPPGWWIESHDGREGEHRLVNGRQEPEIRMAAGQVERWRVVNAASARYVRLSVGGRPFRIIGSGGGLIPAPVRDRAAALHRGAHRDRRRPVREGETLRHRDAAVRSRIVQVAPEAGALRHAAGGCRPRRRVLALPERLREIEPLVTGPVTPTREVRLGFSLG